jgi:hypothetical protein
MAKKLSFKAVEQDNLTAAETWLERIDRPWMNGKTPNERVAAGIDRKAVRRMKEAAMEDIQDGSPHYTTLYVFTDGSALYEKRTDDWFIADSETVARAQENN